MILNLKIGWVQHLVLILGVLAVGTESLIMSPLIDEIGQSFDVDVFITGWSVSAYGLTLATTAPLIALFCRKIARVRLMFAGMMFFCIASFWCAISNSFFELLLARAFCGIGAGLYVPSCYAWIGNHVPYEIRAKFMGRVMAGWSMALIFGVPVGTFLAENFGWRAAFIVVSVVALCALLGLFLLPRLSDKLCSERPAYAEVRFVFQGSSRKILLINFLNMLSFYVCYTFLGVAIMGGLNVGNSIFGLLVVFYGFGLMLSTMNGRLLDKIGKQKALWFSNLGLIAVFSFLALSFFNFWVIALCLVVWGVFQGVAQTSAATLMTLSAGESRGFAMACMSSTTYLAVALGAGLGGWLMQYDGFSSIALISLLAVMMACLLVRKSLIVEVGNKFSKFS